MEAERSAAAVASGRAGAGGSPPKKDYSAQAVKCDRGRGGGPGSPWGGGLCNPWKVLGRYGERGSRPRGSLCSAVLECEGGCEVTSEHPHPTLSSALPGRKNEKDFPGHISTYASLSCPVAKPRPKSLLRLSQAPAQPCLDKAARPVPSHPSPTPGVQQCGVMGPSAPISHGGVTRDQRCSRDQRAVGAPGL